MRSMREKIISSDRGSRGMMAYGVTGGDGKGRISHKLLPPQNATFAAYSLEAFEPLYRHARKKMEESFSLLCKSMTSCWC